MIRRPRQKYFANLALNFANVSTIFENHTHQQNFHRCVTRARHLVHRRCAYIYMKGVQQKPSELQRKSNDIIANNRGTIRNETNSNHAHSNGFLGGCWGCRGGGRKGVGKWLLWIAKLEIWRIRFLWGVAISRSAVQEAQSSRQDPASLTFLRKSILG